MEAGSETPGAPVEVRADGNDEVPSRPSRRRRRRHLAQQESDGLRESGNAESRSRRSRRGVAEPAGSNHPGNVPGSPHEWPFGFPGRRVDSEAEGFGGGHGRPKLAERQAHGTDPSPECRSGYDRGEGSSFQSGTQDAEVEDRDRQDEGQIGTRRRRVPEERTFRDAIPRKEESQQRVRQPSEIQRKGDSDPTSRPAASSGVPGGSKEKRVRRERTTVEEEEETKGLVQEEVPHRSPKRRRGRSERSEGSQPNSSDSGEGSEVSEVNEEEVESALSGFRRWLKENRMDGLTTVQCGAHLMLQILKSGTSFGKYLRRMLEPHEETRQERQRSVLPLPLKDDSWKEMKKVMESGEFKRLAGTWKEKQALGASKTKKEMRKVGLLIWHGLVTASLNFLWSGGRTLGQIARGKPSKAQLMCQERLWESVRVFVDDVSETTEKLVKAPDSGDWNQRLEKMRISYHGEVVEKSQSLTLEQILPGLPPPGFGGKVPLVELCEGEVKRMLLHPEEALLKGLDLPEDFPMPKVMADPEEWEKIGGELYRRGLVRPVEHCARLDGKKIVNGAFGVIKPNKMTESGKEVLRLIMDFRASNAVTRIIEGDVRTLASAPALQHVVMPSGSVLRISAEDLVAAFYLFSLPEAWSQLMCFEKKVKWSSLGMDGRDPHGSVLVSSPCGGVQQLV